METKQSHPVTSLPALGAPFPGQPGVYAGVGTLPDGTLYIRVVLNERPPIQDWHEHKAWTAERGADLPDRMDGAAIHALLPDLRPKSWMYLSEPYDAYDAWFQLSNGNQLIDDEAAKGGGLAVRRLVLDSFDPLGSSKRLAAESVVKLREAAEAILFACDHADECIEAVAEVA